MYQFTLKTSRCFREYVNSEIQLSCALRKHACKNIWEISPPKNWKFSDKNPDSFHISAQNIGCGYSLEPPRRVLTSTHNLCFCAEIRKNNVYPSKPKFYYINYKNYIGIFSWCVQSYQSFNPLWYFLQYPVIVPPGSKCPFQTAWVHRLIWAFAVCRCPENTSPFTRPSYIEIWVKIRMICGWNNMSCI